jgi:hypothetical protein
VLEQAVVMTKDVLMERLCALVPPPRKHLVTYHGILAPASGLRPQVVPRRAQEARGAGGCRHAAGDGADCEGAAPGAAGGAACDESAGNHCDDAFRRQQAERRVRERLRVPHGGGKRRTTTIEQLLLVPWRTLVWLAPWPRAARHGAAVREPRAPDRV